ncbi:uncharacterized mitochondrial protein AtMg00820-like [Humulus lupulus]|uniref:uncharacterized mitochondrial protein AtMg00820-like n=1 Tax=Humulus lupulus TaxID=3486 RepID=UPI002B40EACA|nr:uncharacterized mitochondrial protein AtMg00820-like [Humulus lupulus]
MVTRAKSGIHKSKAFATTKELNPHMPPKSYKQALLIPHWKHAMELELQALRHNSTWQLVPCLPATNIIGCKWLFKLKYKPGGSIERHKTRLVARGFTQTAGWPLRQIDVHNTFLDGDLIETVYMSQPSRFHEATVRVII